MRMWKARAPLCFTGLSSQPLGRGHHSCVSLGEWVNGNVSSLSIVRVSTKQKSNRIHDQSHLVACFVGFEKNIYFPRKTSKNWERIYWASAFCRSKLSLNSHPIPIPRLFPKTNSFNLNRILLPTYYSVSRIESNKILWDLHKNMKTFPPCPHPVSPAHP